MKKGVFLKACLMACLLGGASGCFGMFGFGSSKDNLAFDSPAQVLASEAESLYRDGNYQESAEYFQQLKDRYPYSRYALLADLRVGDAYFKADRFEEAVLAYDDFIRLHPKNEAVPYAIYQLGMVYHKQMLTPDRDPTQARKAADTFERLTKQYPKSEWAQKALPRWQEAVERLAGHDLFVGRFYLRTKRYQAAIGRFKRVLTAYPDVGLYGAALKGIEQSQEALAKLPAREKAEEYDPWRDLVAPPQMEDIRPGSVSDGTIDRPGPGM